VLKLNLENLEVEQKNLSQNVHLKLLMEVPKFNKASLILKELDLVELLEYKENELLQINLHLNELLQINLHLNNKT